MKSELLIFKNAEFGELRMADIEGKPWFAEREQTRANCRESLSFRREKRGDALLFVKKVEVWRYFFEKVVYKYPIYPYNKHNLTQGVIWLCLNIKNVRVAN